VARGRDRSQAIENMARALSEFSISGIETNIGFLRLILEHPDYRRGDVNTKWLEKMLAAANGRAEQEVV
jgi:acetyl-CoA carboxylase biotin carboxylase subunit